MTRLFDAFRTFTDQPVVRSFTLLFVRVALAAIFWRSGRTKIEEGTLFDISDTTFFLFKNEYSGVPLPHELAAYMATDWLQKHGINAYCRVSPQPASSA